MRKIQSEDYVDMTELLRDNMEMGRTQSQESTAYLGGGARPSRREVSDVIAKLDRLFWDIC